MNTRSTLRMLAVLGATALVFVLIVVTATSGMNFLVVRGTASAVNLKDGNFQASTTSFSLYGQTACGCQNQQALIDSLADIDWYGAATPAWLGSPYSDAYPNTGWNCDACPSQECNANLKTAGIPFNNCAKGPAGCMQCLELTVLGTPNIYGVSKVPAGTVVNAVVLDNCEMNNQYGNNEQWCVPFSDVPAGGCELGPEAGDPACAEPACATTLSSTAVTQVGGSWSAGVWDFGACGSAEAFTCTNGAGQPAHVDLALDQVSKRPWDDTTLNPLVTVKYISCPDEVESLFKENCASQSGTECTY